MSLDALALQIATATAVQLQSDLSSGKLTSVQLVLACLSNIEKYDRYLHAVICSAPHERVVRAAAMLDDERAAGKVRGPLHGIPVLVKVTLSHFQTCKPDMRKLMVDVGSRTTSPHIQISGWIPRQAALHS